MLNAPVSLSLFTSGTFKTLHKTASIPGLLPSAKEIIHTAKKYFDAEYQILNYKLDFPSVREMFIYIKKSGVSGSRNALNFSQIKDLMKKYPLSYLEFEIVLIHEKL
jgi:malonyl-CoA O-methyltransferase